MARVRQDVEGIILNIRVGATHAVVHWGLRDIASFGSDSSVQGNVEAEMGLVLSD